MRLKTVSGGVRPRGSIVALNANLARLDVSAEGFEDLKKSNARLIVKNDDETVRSLVINILKTMLGLRPIYFNKCGPHQIAPVRVDSHHCVQTSLSRNDTCIDLQYWERKDWRGNNR